MQPPCRPTAVLAIVVVTIAVLLAATGCPGAGGGEGEGEGEGDGGNNGPVDVGCSFDEDCGAGTICDVASGDCVAGFDCSQNATICAFCGTDPSVDCGFGTEPAYCDAGTCRRQRPSCASCSDDAQCAPAASGLPSRCADGFCATGCGACPAGFACVDGGCVPVAGSDACEGALSCRDGAACPDGQTCTDLGVCLSLCSSDDECPFGQICELTPGPQQQQCRPGCPLGDHVVQDGVDKVCHADGRYGLPCPAEGSTTNCPPGTECDAAGVCQRAGCQSDAECPLPRTFCDVGTATCVDGCNSVDDCGAFELCEAGQCRAQGCRGKDLSCDLGEWCCGKERFADASTCPSGVADGQCFAAPDPWCRPCEDNDACSDIQENGFASFCFELQNADGQSLGKFCSVGCTSNADCPRGLDCVLDLPDGNGGTTQGCLDALCPAVAATH